MMQSRSSRRRGKVIQQIEERPWLHSKKSGKKPYAVECKYIGEHKSWMLSHWSDGKWRVWKRYRTEKDAQAAVESMNKKTYHGHRLYEYRIQPSSEVNDD